MCINVNIALKMPLQLAFAVDNGLRQPDRLKHEQWEDNSEGPIIINAARLHCIMLSLMSWACHASCSAQQQV